MRISVNDWLADCCSDGTEVEMQTATEVTRVTPEEIKARMDRGEPIAFIDARNPQAWGESKEKVPGAIRVPADEVEEHLSEIPRDRTIVAYCT
ncbi:MAG TPA: rhodanese-like domain-containing protein [Thermoanaerobaculia bacterium]|nr:rhodanese-like domain-containing protein [Thermoanaerobaculia bacterium]